MVDEIKNPYVFIKSNSFADDGFEDTNDDDYRAVTIEITEVGPFFYALEGKGLDCHQIGGYLFQYSEDKVKKSDQIIPEENLISGEKYWLVIVRHSDYDSFGSTSGYFDPISIHETESKALGWVEKHKALIEVAYYVFDSIELKQVLYLSEDKIAKRG